MLGIIGNTCHSIVMKLSTSGPGNYLFHYYVLRNVVIILFFRV